MSYSDDARRRRARRAAELQELSVSELRLFASPVLLSQVRAKLLLRGEGIWWINRVLRAEDVGLIVSRGRSARWVLTDAGRRAVSLADAAGHHGAARITAAPTCT